MIEPKFNTTILNFEGPPDEYLVKMAVGGDRQAFAQLVKRHERSIKGYHYTRTRNPGLVDELTQETFVQAYLSLGRITTPRAFLGWLFGIARNVHLGELRRSGKNPPEQAPRQHSSVLRRRNELFETIRKVVHDLPETYREVMCLRYFGGLTCALIAETLDRDIGTVTKQLSRGHALVSKAIQNCHGFTTTLGFWLKDGEK